MGDSRKLSTGYVGISALVLGSSSWGSRPTSGTPSGGTCRAKRSRTRPTGSSRHWPSRSRSRPTTLCCACATARRLPRPVVQGCGRAVQRRAQDRPQAHRRDDGSGPLALRNENPVPPHATTGKSLSSPAAAPCKTSTSGARPRCTSWDASRFLRTSSTPLSATSSPRCEFARTLRTPTTIWRERSTARAMQKRRFASLRSP